MGVGAPPGGPGREAEERVSGGAAHGAHTIAHRPREGEVLRIFLYFSNCASTV